MRRSLFLLLSCVFSIQSIGQDLSFQGKITYKFEFIKTETGEDLSSQLGPYLGMEQHYFVNEHNYKAFTEKGVLTQLYIGQTNKFYFVNPMDQSVMELDARENPTPLAKIETFEGSERIADIDCRKLIIRTENDETTYWYAPSVAVPYQNFKNHRYGNWGAYLEATQGALPLKYVVKNKIYTIIATAKTIEQLDLSDQDFDISSMLVKE